MTAWTKDEFRNLASSDDLHIAPFREDGVTYGTLTWTWSVVLNDALYVRAYNEKQSRWYQAANKQQAGKIAFVGTTKAVEFSPVDGEINDRIDEAYRKKYAGSPYLTAMIGTFARSATILIMPGTLK